MLPTKLRTLLEPHGQEHLIKYWNELDDAGRERLRADIISIGDGDIGQAVRCFEQAKSEQNGLGKKLDALMTPLEDEAKGSYESCSPQELSAYERRGLEAIAKNEVAVLLLAGGQGTRLGVEYPKGMYSVHLPSNKTLFQLQAERLTRVKQLAEERCGSRACRLPWYIMASEATLESTKRFFAKHDYFGIDRTDIFFFEQGTLPCFGYDGRILLERKDKVARAPDGNGGLYRALLKQRVLDDMNQRGIKYLHIYCVDNVLVRMADPIFTGFCINKQANCGSKAVRKLDPDEKV